MDVVWSHAPATETSAEGLSIQGGFLLDQMSFFEASFQVTWCYITVVPAGVSGMADSPRLPRDVC